MKTLGQFYFLLAACIFLLHQFTEKILDYHIPFFDNYLDPFLCTPILLTFLLFERRVFFRQGPHFTLSGLEIITASVVIMLISEGLFPYLSPQFTADYHDLIGLFLGSVYFHFFINQPLSP